MYQNPIKTALPNQFQHVILISLDSLRFDCIQGESKYIDKILDNGTFFNRCITAAPYTTAAHAAYFTGCWPRNNNVYEFFNRSITKSTLFELAKKSGYKTIFQTDFPIILGDSIGFTKGVDNYFIEDEESALKCLLKNHNQKTVSFFHFGGIHYPYGFHKLKFGGKDYENKVKHLERVLHIKQDDLVNDMLDESYRNKKDAQFLFRYKRILEKLDKEKKYIQIDILYREGIKYFMKNRFDKFIKKLLEFIERENAVLFLFADHGESWDSTSKGHANSISHSVLHVPLVVYGKTIEKKNVNSLVRTIDVLPTIFDLTGIAKSKVDGKSLLHPILDDGRHALGQVWRTGNKHKVKLHQQKILSKQGMIKPLKTHLEKEAVYLGNYALVNEYQNEKINKQTTFSFTNTNNIIEAQIPKKVTSIMLRLLEQYNNKDRKKTGNTKKLTKVEKQIVADLNLMGYNV